MMSNKDTGKHSGWKEAVRLVLLILQAAAVCAFLVGLFLGVRLAVNAMFIREYHAGNYSETPEKFGLAFNIGESYVIPYNLGNADFQLGDYDKAIGRYMKARSMKLPEDKECNVRINLALSYCHTVDWKNLDLTDDDAIDKAVETLQQARGFLTENGCADEAADKSDGHSKDAEKLKHDIDEKIRELQKQKEQNNQDQDQNDQNKDKDDSENQSEQQTEDQQDQNDQDEQEQNSKTEEQKKEQKKQQELKEKLKEQKKELHDGADQAKVGPDGHTYQDVRNDSVAGYGEGMPW